MRRILLKALAVSPDGMSIAALTRKLPISRTAVNKHLAILSDAGLVKRQAVGREARYLLSPDPLSQLAEWLAFFDPYGSQHLSALAQSVERDGQAT